MKEQEKGTREVLLLVLMTIQCKVCGLKPTPPEQDEDTWTLLLLDYAGEIPPNLNTNVIRTLLFGVNYSIFTFSFFCI